MNADIYHSASSALNACLSDVADGAISFNSAIYALVNWGKMRPNIQIKAVPTLKKLQLKKIDTFLKNYLSDIKQQFAEFIELAIIKQNIAQFIKEQILNFLTQSCGSEHQEVAQRKKRCR